MLQGHILYFGLVCQVKEFQPVCPSRTRCSLLFLETWGLLFPLREGPVRKSTEEALNG